MELIDEIRTDANFAEAVEAEVLSINRLLPPRWDDIALRPHVEQVASWLRAASRTHLPAVREDVVLARKVGRGARPLSIMSLQDRLLYRLMTGIVERRLGHSADRGHDAHQAFLDFPSQVEGCQYVLKTDIAAFYQYVDHERLVAEVVAQTGDDLAITGIADLLRETSGRSYGLPQLSPASDVLADVYIDPMRRDLERAGYPVARFADDFRVACASYDDALSAWERADESARRLGLVLNEQKTSTPSIQTYQNSLDALRQREHEMLQMLDLGGYMDSVEAPGQLLNQVDHDEADTLPTYSAYATAEVTEEQIQVAQGVVSTWTPPERGGYKANDDVDISLLRAALRVLTIAHKPDALERVGALVVYEPSLTPVVSEYLIACAGADRRDVVRELDNLCSSAVLNTWQAVWIAHVAGSIARRRTTRVTSPHVQWLMNLLESQHGVLAANACLALARRRLIDTERACEVLDRLSEPYRPSGILAIGTVSDASVVERVADSLLDRLRLTWAMENL